MGIFNWKSSKGVTSGNTHFIVDGTVHRVMEAMDYKLLLKVVDEISDKVVKEIYPEVLKQLDKELIVKEVSVQVSDKILQGIFNSSPKAQSKSNNKEDL